MAPLRNHRHEIFVRALVRFNLQGVKDRTEGWQQRVYGSHHGKGYGEVWKAYKEAYPHVTAHRSLLSNSSRLHRRPEIKKRIEEVTKKALTRMDITEERILSQYDEAYELAKSQGKTADMVSASTAQAKLVGLLRDRIEAGAPGDFDKLENVSDVLAAVEKQAGPEAALMLAKVLGVSPPEDPAVEPSEGQEEASEPDTANLEALEPPSGSVN